MDLVATALDGILLGGLYALFASGLSLIFGVMRLVNIAHGDLIVLSSFIALVVTDHFGVHPLVSLVLVVPFMALLGYALQRGIFNRALDSDILRPVLVSFGVSVFLQNALLQTFSADSRRLQAGNLETLQIDLPGDMAVGVLPCLMFMVALVVIGGLQLLFEAIIIGGLGDLWGTLVGGVILGIAQTLGARINHFLEKASKLGCCGDQLNARMLRSIPESVLRVR